MRVIVTGGAGFIGSHIVDALVDDGAELLVIDNLTTGRETNLVGASKRAGGKLRFEKADIRSDSIPALVKSFAPQAIIHQAAQINVRASVSDPMFDSSVNVSGTVNMLESARLAGVPRFLFSSTGGAIYGEQEIFPAPEEHPVRAESAYGVGKRCAELYIDYFSRTYNLTGVVLRYANVYGPRQNPKGEAGVVAIFTEKLFKGESLRVNGDGKQTRDFVYVGDVMQANRLALGYGQAGKMTVFNVGRGVETSVLDIVGAISILAESGRVPGKASKDIKIEHGPALPGEQRRSVVDFAKIKRELGWQPTVDLEAGLERTLASHSSL